MKCALVLLAAVLCFCSLYTCAKSSTYMQKISLPNLNMRSSKLKEAILSSVKPKTVTGTVKGTVPVTGGTGSTVTVTGDVTGTVTATTGTVTLTGKVTCSGATVTPGSSVTCNVADDSGTPTVSALTGTLTGTFTGTGSVSISVTDTISCTFTTVATEPLICTVAGTNTDSATGAKFSGSLTSAKGAVKNDEEGTRDAGAEGSNGGTAASASTTTTTTTEAPETTTTSTEAPQQSTEKPPNPTEGKTDSSNSHVASHVALFIGTIALLSVV